MELEGPVLSVDPGSYAPVATRLSENIPHDPIAAPLLIAQGESDPMISAGIQEQFVKHRCAAGQSLEYRTYKGGTHISIVAPNSLLTSDLIQWTQDRFAGKPQQPGCHTIPR
jgi:alpha-beta hydrolase superfamily lysophospholipase